MALTLEALPRVFTYNAIALDDPDPKMPPEDVKQFWANIYPELTQSQVEGPHNEPERVAYKFVRTVGTKGVISVVDLINSRPSDQRPPDLPFDGFLMERAAQVLLRAARGERMVLPPSEVLEPVP